MRSGSDSFLLFQSTSAAIGDPGAVLGFETEMTWGFENEILDEMSKEGRVVGYGDTSESVEFTAYHDTQDPAQNAVMSALENKEQVKVWKVDKQKNANGKHSARFAYAIVESMEMTAASDGFQEYTGSLQVLGNSKKGELDKIPEKILSGLNYSFEEPGEYTGEIGKNHSKGEEPEEPAESQGDLGTEF
ncbi:phage major tail protein, TP901-1 family [Shouchella clausii]|uniref:phage major tail protein, TP901-1 family n=1 Tax=Shouchella clausii TaxID=79880 RepID=UPI000BA7C96F|nr:phage major tail protein, TP901-1 family [Shouchella clausii]PAF13703.1 phage major tail protein, TP901-1 family [Shouchella clausii]